MKRFLFILVTFLVIGVSFGQSRRKLETRRKRLSKDIRKIEKILSQTRRKKVSALEDLKDYRQKVTVRENLIGVIELEISQINKDIDINEYTITKNEEELKVLKVDYAKMLYKSYKSKSKQSKALFLMSSKDFNQAYKRLKYINEYKVFLKNQGLTIIEKSEAILILNDSLKIAKLVKEILITKKEKEKIVISKEKKLQERVVSKIRREERKYRIRLKDKFKQDRKISKKIRRIIADAIRRVNRKKKSSSKELVLTAEETILKERFEHNKGKLPSPVKTGYVTRKFGIQRHPTFKKIKINSTGIHIRCKKGDRANSVFNGKVLVVQLLSKGRKSVFIQHGNYISTYTNLQKVFVKKGQKVKTGDALGRIFTDNVTGKTTLQFVLSRNTKRLDPLKWLNK